MAPIYLSGVGGTVAESMWWVGRLRSLCGGWLYSDYNASLSSNWTELDWTGTELGNVPHDLVMSPGNLTDTVARTIIADLYI